MMYSLLGTLILVLDLVAIIDVLGGRSDMGRKVLWTLVIVFLPVVGMILYFLIGRDARDRRVLEKHV